MNAPSAYLLDANVISEMMRPTPEPRVAEFLNRTAQEGLGVASITVWEILNGLGRLEPGRRRHDLVNGSGAFSTRSLGDGYSTGPLTTLAHVQTSWKKGAGVASHSIHHLPDAMLAGTALSRGLTIVTRNEREFRNTGAALVNPWVSPPRSGR